jgi:cytochrome b subunit of formate dehydrogenase
MHNFAGPLFAVSLVIIFFTFLRDNWPQKGDLRWLPGGGLFSKGTSRLPTASTPARSWSSGAACSCWASWWCPPAWCWTS